MILLGAGLVIFGVTGIGPLSSIIGTILAGICIVTGVSILTKP